MKHKIIKEKHTSNEELKAKLTFLNFSIQTFTNSRYFTVFYVTKVIKYYI